MRRGPRPICIERPAIEVPEVDLVELGLDDDRDFASVEHERERILRAGQPGGQRDVDRLVRERDRESSRLVDALGRQTLAGDGRGRDVVAVRAGEPVPDEQELAHG